MTIFMMVGVEIVEGAAKLSPEMTETITVFIAVERVARLCDIGRADKTVVVIRG